jgi:hypothetical protein
MCGRVNASDPNGDQLTFQWVMLKEVIERSQGGAREIEPEDIQFEIHSDSNGELVFTAPAEKGEYRLFPMFMMEMIKPALPIYHSWWNNELHEFKRIARTA